MPTNSSFLYGQRLWPGHHGAASLLLEHADHLLQALERIDQYRVQLSPLVSPVLRLEEHYESPLVS